MANDAEQRVDAAEPVAEVAHNPAADVQDSNSASSSSSSAQPALPSDLVPATSYDFIPGNELWVRGERCVCVHWDPPHIYWRKESAEQSKQQQQQEEEEQQQQQQTQAGPESEMQTETDLDMDLDSDFSRPRGVTVGSLNPSSAEVGQHGFGAEVAAAGGKYIKHRPYDALNDAGVLMVQASKKKSAPPAWASHQASQQTDELSEGEHDEWRMREDIHHEREERDEETHDHGGRGDDDDDEDEERDHEAMERRRRRHSDEEADDEDSSDEEEEEREAAVAAEIMRKQREEQQSHESSQAEEQQEQEQQGDQSAASEQTPPNEFDATTAPSSTTENAVTPAPPSSSNNASENAVRSPLLSLFSSRPQKVMIRDRNRDSDGAASNANDNANDDSAAELIDARAPSGVHLENCSGPGLSFRVPSKVANITLVECRHLHLSFPAVISTVELIRCHHVSLRCDEGPASSYSIDDSTECDISFPAWQQRVMFVSTNSNATNLHARPEEKPSRMIEAEAEAETGQEESAASSAHSMNIDYELTYCIEEADVESTSEAGNTDEATAQAAEPSPSPSAAPDSDAAPEIPSGSGSTVPRQYRTLWHAASASFSTQPLQREGMVGYFDNKA